MSDRTHHSEWLSLIDVSGPFLAEPVLKEAFPQGLGGLDSAKKTMLRQAYDEWREARDLDDPLLPKIHPAWIDLVLKQGLELDEQGKGDVLKPRAALPETLAYALPEHGVTLRPDYAVVDAEDKPLMLVAAYDPDISLSDARKGDAWAASPAERMVELCRATGARLGLVTNGEHWMFVDAPVNAATTMANWYARLWGQEPLTLQAFVNLLGIRRFFVDRSEQLPALLDKSLEHQDEVTDALGEQVRRAVEVLIQGLERADVDRKRELLEGIEPTELYEAGLTVMMRIVFLLSAEERGLLLMGDPRYEANYAISTLRLQLRASSDEILERRWDAWSRLLSMFRAVYGGIDHDSMRLPALGGSLFDPDRYPFLEGRTKGSNWKSDPAKPLPIDNRTVLLLLEAVQLFQGRTLSYLALDVEQIGYVYEGLLERTAVRAAEVTLDLAATKSADNPWVSLPELDAAAAKGGKALEDLLKERTGSAASRVRNDLGRQVDDASTERLLAACHGDRDLRDRIKPYFHLLRTDPWGYPLVYPKGTFMVRTSSDRRETGTHYTPKPLTEAIVTETLEPLVYIGPSEGEPRDEWKLKTPSELLDLKICDPAMGSGAFLVQVCRWLSERLVESWQAAEAQGKAITAEGDVLDALGANEPLRPDPAERLLIAKRAIAERCLYGVDMNPLAVELAKLSIWLVTLAKGRPFGFLDHNLRSGDSLLGLQSLDQLKYLELKPGHSSSKRLFASNIDKAIEEALALRAALRTRPIRDIRDIAAMADLNEEATKRLTLPHAIADALFAQVLKAEGRPIDVVDLSVEAGEAVAGSPTALEALRRRALDLASASTPFHWPLSFPEVFASKRGGFDAFVGNPPFLGGQRISGVLGVSYKEYLAHRLSFGDPATADLVVYFFLRAFRLLSTRGYLGFLARRNFSEGKNREIGLEQIINAGATVHAARTNIPWPGKAAVVVHQIHIAKSPWAGPLRLDDKAVARIDSHLGDVALPTPRTLSENTRKMFQGIILNNEAFKLRDGEAQALLEKDTSNKEVVFPFIGGNEINSFPDQRPAYWVVNFWDWPLNKAQKHEAPFSLIDARATRKSGNWWRPLRPRPDLHHAIGRGHHFIRHPRGWQGDVRRYARVLAISRRVTKYCAFTFLDNNFLFSDQLYVLADDRFSVFALLSSDIHAVWAWHQKTSMGADLHSLSYTNGEIFETFPFADGMMSDGDAALDRLGEKFFKSRQSLMEELGAGLTGVYNAFHDQTRNDARLLELRRQQAEINRTVLARYGWDDVRTEEAFQEVAYLPAGSNVRFTVSETARLEILKRLAMLNRERSEKQEEAPGSITQGDQDEPLEEGLFAPREIRRGI
ncbi:Eco57I restriction-modification methylase domain-containing protein [Bradyrhizobium sp. SZCCHNPS1003]|uniref:Eco57I restriction-modification methylase domain-containing protein n=1 Tax=Bradyrhizobium sp. SZCCHNPS1003 TaxID=3057330 RepID=UPI0028E2E3D6|nr:type IIL restriction-modification enzyme MmeI [Bradyrhizobium sp. SZCCHNPS1003]